VVGADNTPFITDLNPRRQGGYVPNILAGLATTGIDLVELECQVFFDGVGADHFTEGQFQSDFAWGTSRLPVWPPGAPNDMTVVGTPPLASPESVFDGTIEAYESLPYERGSRLVRCSPCDVAVRASNRADACAALKASVQRFTESYLDSRSRRDTCNSGARTDSAPPGPLWGAG
jgi:hypothetical protein